MDSSLHVDLPLIIQLLISTILPIIVGLVTKWTTSGGTQALLLAALSIVSSGLTEFLVSIQDGETFDLGTWLVAAVGTFVVAVATHYGLWKPTGATAAALSVGDKSNAPRR